jgi:hypothetical protein
MSYYPSHAELFLPPIRKSSKVNKIKFSLPVLIEYTHDFFFNNELGKSGEENWVGDEYSPPQPNS